MKHKPQGSRKKTRYAQLRAWLDLPGNSKKTYAEYEKSKEYRMAHDD